MWTQLLTTANVPVVEVKVPPERVNGAWIVMSSAPPVKVPSAWVYPVVPMVKDLDWVIVPV